MAQLQDEQLVKSRHRVRAYGEVFTPRHMVDRMLDLVREELETGPDFVDKTFLEPAAGHGNFLVAILHRKLRAVEKNYAPEEWPEASLFALASIYGIELLEDNHRHAKETMLAEFLHFHKEPGVPCGPDTSLRQAAAFLIDTNVVRGDTLAGLDWRGEQIQFSWWNRITGAPGMVQREPFTLASLRDDDAFDFTVYDRYRACRIDKVHEGVKGTLVYGALCLVESDWGLLDRPFQIGDGVWVLYPGALRKRLKKKGSLTVDRMKLVADALDRALPPASR